jgi:hypothetical protein
MEPEQGLALIEQVGQKIHGGTCRVLTSADLLAFQPTEFHDGTQTPDTIACVRAQTSRAQPLTTIIILRQARRSAVPQWNSLLGCWRLIVRSYAATTAHEKEICSRLRPFRVPRWNYSPQYDAAARQALDLRGPRKPPINVPPWNHDSNTLCVGGLAIGIPRISTVEPWW